MRPATILGLTIFLLPTGLPAAEPWLSVEAEAFQLLDAQRRDFGGVIGVVFPKKEGSIRTSVTLARPERAEVWARVYFPWAGQDTLTLALDQQTFMLSARTAAAGGRWDVGNFQVWHWVRAGTAELAAGKHELALTPVGSSGQRVDRVVLYWGKEPAWSQPWLTDGARLSDPAIEWTQAASLVIPAVDFDDVQADVETLGKRKVAVLRNDADRLVTVFKTPKTIRARVWARVYFEAKNMYEGLTMEEMAGDFFLLVDGQLLKTVYEQNARQWHWVAVDEPLELTPGLHCVTLRKQGLPVKVDQFVLDPSGEPLDQTWFRSPPPPGLLLGIAAAPEVGRAGHWRVHAADRPGAMELPAEREGPAQWPVRIELPPGAATVDLVRVAGMAENPTHADRTPSQQISVWVKNGGGSLTFDVLYTDRHGEAFFERLHEGPAWSGWRLLSADVPSRIEGSDAGFDATGYAIDSAVTPPADAGARSTAAVGIAYAGGDRNAVPDFPLEVRALRLVKPAGRNEIVLGEPFFESPLTLRTRLVRQTDNQAVFNIEVQNHSQAEKTASVEYRFGDRLADPTDAATREALMLRHPVAVRPNATATVSVTLDAQHPGIHYLECRVGRGPAMRRHVALGQVWQEKLAELRRQWEHGAGGLRFSPDGSDRLLKKADGSPLQIAEVAAEYGADKGLVVLDDGLDVCSLAYAERRDFASPIRPRGFDLSDEAGWPHVPVPNGVLAIDPALGRLKFAEADSRKLSLRSAQVTGFGVPGPPVVVRGRFAYPGPGEGHYSVVDCSDKAHPRVVAQIPSWYFSSHLLPLGNRAYFESSKRGLILVDDLSNPYCPGPLRQVHFNRALHGRMDHIFEEDRVGYSTGGQEPGLWVFDLADPLYPRKIAHIDGPSEFFPVARLAFTYVGNAVRALDVSNRRQPKLLPGGIDRETFAEGKKKTTVFAATDDALALLTDRRIDLYRYTADGALTAEKLVSLDVPKESGGHVFGTFHRGLLYVIDGKDGPGQYSLGADSPASRWFIFQYGKDKAEQVGLYEHPWPSAFGSVTIVEQTAYVSDYNYGLWTFDLSDPRKPKRLGGAVTAGESDALWIDGQRAYQWQTFGGAVFLLDISDPDAPKRLGEVWDGAWLPYDNSRRGNQTVAGKDGFLYIPRQGRGLLVVDVRDPAHPKPAGEFKDQQGDGLKRIYGACIDVWGDRAYVLLKDRLLLYDVAKAAEPHLVSTTTIPEADLLCAKGDRVCLGHRDGRFVVVDAANAAKPAVLGTLDLAPSCPVKMDQVISGLTVAKGHAYLTARGPGSEGANFLHVVDLADPRTPRWITTFDPRPELPRSPCEVWADFYQDIIADGDLLFIGGYGEIQCLDISVPAAPKLIDVLDVGFQWSVGRKSGGHLYVPALTGLMVLRAPSSSQAPIGKLETKARF